MNSPSHSIKTWNTAVITGATTGIGRALTQKLAAAGTQLMVCARNQSALLELQQELGPSVHTRQVDVQDTHAVQQFMAEAETTLGPLDLVIANAGVSRTQAAHKIDYDRNLDILRTNVLGACATLSAALPNMVARGHGHLVGISSPAGERGLPGAAAYCASKAALSVYLQSLHLDVHKKGIRISDIRPGFIDTPLTQKNRFHMPFLLKAEPAADKIIAALRRGDRIFTFPWQMHALMRIFGCIPDSVYEWFATRSALKT